TSTSFTVSVTGSDPSGPGNSAASGIVSIAIFTQTDGGTFSFWTTVTPANPSAQFNGLAGHTYGFYSIATDLAGNFQPTPAAAQQSVQILAPLAINSIASVSPNPRNTPLSSLNVTFNLPIDVNNISSSAVTLTDNGNPVAVSGISFVLVSG